MGCGGVDYQGGYYGGGGVGYSRTLVRGML